MEKYQKEKEFMNIHGISEFDIPKELKEASEGKQIMYNWEEGE